MKKNNVKERLFLVACLLLMFFQQKIYAQNNNEEVFEYHLISSVPVNHLYAGKIMGVTASEGDDKIVSTKILKGSLPDGMKIFDDGTIAVTGLKENLNSGKYKVKVEFYDALGNVYVEKLKLKILDPSIYKDVEASVRIEKTKFTNPTFTNHYKLGDVIAQFHDKDGVINEANLIKGSIPPGIRLIGNDKFIVTDPDELQDGEYFSLFILEDEKGGSSVLAISIPVGVQSGDKSQITKLEE